MNQNSDYTYSQLQMLFCEKRKNQLKRWMEEPFFKNDSILSYRTAIRYFYEGTVAEGFLKNNWDYGDYLKEMTENFLKNSNYTATYVT